MLHNAMNLNPVDFTFGYRYSLFIQEDKVVVLSTLKKS